MTLRDFLLSIRERLIDAANSNQAQVAEDIFITVFMLRDISYERHDEELTSLIVDLVNAARDLASGVKGKMEIPSIEDIEVLFPPASKAS